VRDQFVYILSWTVARWVQAHKFSSHDKVTHERRTIDVEVPCQVSLADDDATLHA